MLLFAKTHTIPPANNPSKVQICRRDPAEQGFIGTTEPLFQRLGPERVTILT